MSEKAIIHLENITRHFQIGTITVKALNGISITIKKNEFVALMGPSGSGKSTLMNLLGCLDTPTGGNYFMNGTDVSTMNDNELAEIRNKEIGFIFQTFNLLPRSTALENVMLPQIYAGHSKTDRMVNAKDALTKVKLADRMDHRPNELSGGQRQRISIARAVSLKPDFIVCDEPVSSLDVSVQAQVMNLLMDLKERYGLSYLFISHDLSVVSNISDQTAVMYLGKIMEYGEVEAVIGRPLHPYTRALVSAVPHPDPTRRPERIVLTGEPPSPTTRHTGCPFAARCFHPDRDARCTAERPMLRDVGGREVACHHAT